MVRTVNPVLRDQWRQRIDRQPASGLSITAFCSREGVSQASFHAWKRRLHGPSPARRSSSQASAARGSRKRPGASRGPAGARRVVVGRTVPTPGAGFLQLPVRAASSSPWIEFSLIDGTVVRVPQENLAALTTVLRVLRGDDGRSLAGEAHHA